MAEGEREGERCSAMGRRSMSLFDYKWQICSMIIKHRQRQIEYLVVCYDDDNRKVRLSLRQADILKALAEDEKLLNAGGGVPGLKCGEAR